MSQSFAHPLQPRWKAFNHWFRRAVVDALQWIPATLLGGEDSNEYIEFIELRVSKLGVA